MEQPLTIGQFAQLTGVPAKTIRYYEQVGVLPEPSRSPAGYRQNGPRDQHRLLFIRRARTLGLPLSDIKMLTVELDQGACSAMRPRLLELVQAQVDAVQRQIADCQLLQQQLEQLSQRLLTQPPSDHTAGCQCLNLDATALTQADAPPPEPAIDNNPMDAPSALASLTLLDAPSGGDGRCGCGCGCSLVQLSVSPSRLAPAAPEPDVPTGQASGHSVADVNPAGDASS